MCASCLGCLLAWLADWLPGWRAAWPAGQGGAAAWERQADSWRILATIHAPLLTPLLPRVLRHVVPLHRALRTQRFLDFTAHEIAAHEGRLEQQWADIEARRRGKIVSKEEMDAFYARLQVGHWLGWLRLPVTGPTGLRFPARGGNCLGGWGWGGGCSSI